MGITEVQRLIDMKSLTALKKFALAEQNMKLAKEQHDKVIEQIKEAMIANNITKIDGDWGYITLAEKTTYKTEDIDDVADEYTKRALDTAKIKAQAVLAGQLPAGVTETKTQYITKKLKDV